MWSWFFVIAILFLYRRSLLKLPEKSIIYEPNSVYVTQKDWQMNLERKSDYKIERTSDSYLGIPKYELTFPSGVKGIIYSPNHLNR